MPKGVGYKGRSGNPGGGTVSKKSGSMSPRNYDPKDSDPSAGGGKPNKGGYKPPKGPHNDYKGV